MKRSILLSAATMLLLASCGNNISETESNMDDNSISFKRIEAAKAYTLENSAADYDTDSDLTVACRVNVLMPENIFGQDLSQLKDAIEISAFGNDSNRILENFFHSAAAEFGYAPVAINLNKEQSDSLSKYAVRLSDYDGCTSIDGDVTTLNNAILSYAITSTSYSPRAAHGMYSTTYINYDIRNGKVITLDDLFTQDGLNALPEIIANKAKYMSPIIGRTNIEALPSDGNFYVSDSGDIVFAYGPYEVASYAQGIIRIPLAPYLLSEYLTETGKSVLL